MAYSDSWQRLQDWTVEKIKNCDGALIPMDRDSIRQRQEPELDYQFMLEAASRTMIRFKKPERLIRMIVRVMDEQVKVTHTAMLLRKDASGPFTLIDSKGAEGVKIPVGFIKLTDENSLIRLFNERHNYKMSESGSVGYKDLLNFLQRDPATKSDSDLKSIVEMAIKQMELLKATLCVPVYYKKDLIGVLILGKKLSNVKFSRQEIGFFTTLANDVAMALSNAQLIQDLQDKIFEVHNLYEREHSLFIHTAISLAAAIDARDPYTHGHTERVTQYALSIAEELQELPEAAEYANFKETLHISGLLHDVGKIGVPDGILNKKSSLTDDEYEKLKEHSVTGAAILYPIRELGDVAREVRCHHERWDGKGYPDGLKGEEIPFISRIISVADTFDAITSDRPYRQKKMAEVAIQIIKDNSGSQFDPIVVSAFLLAHRKGKFGNVS
ncbi:MAG: HD-GYP domain-containing protein [Candidatus Omnitrophica bacterium]|nr:HD-GYP domain-containing protein [Patescibacteria group bacterium]MDD5487932.1 HD-GYP domain-containing protein [Candidatus Omnitrophota bacterium]